MGIVRLGELVLRWCHTCNLPIIRQRKCVACGNPSTPVQVTPPGDIRPAFDHDIDLIREIVSHQFGGTTGQVLIPDNKIVVLNRAPGLDTIDEIIIDGVVVGSLYFDILNQRFKVIIRLEGADLIKKDITKGFVIVDEGAAAAISRGGSVLVPGITDQSDGIAKGDELIVLDPDHNVIATGFARMSGTEISSNNRGSAIKNRWYGDYSNIVRDDKDISWSDVILANSEEMGFRIDKAIKFIERVASEESKPIVVSFSGGKDSLATLLLVLEAGLKPDLIFINTGLELEETVIFTEEVAKKYGLRLLVEDAGVSFWKYVDYFGPPGKDFRWCCKTSKLGPASKLIKRNYPDGVLSFIGQRSYESEPRSRKGEVWENPWVPGQYAASPIQRWTAMHVWLYLFSKNAPINPWYRRGLDRIGCWLCPASNLSELQIIKENYQDYKKWEDKLESFIKKYELADSWLRYGLWRWKKQPKELINLIGEKGTVTNIRIERHTVDDNSELDMLKKEEAAEIHTLGKYQFISLGGFEDCKGELSLEGAFNFQFDFNTVCDLLNILGEVDMDHDGNSCSIGHGLIIFRNGTLSIKGKDRKDINKTLRDVFSIVIRSKDCVECGICTSRCPSDALTLDGGLKNDPGQCNHCKKCLKPCTVTDFGRDDVIEF